MAHAYSPAPTPGGSPIQSPSRLDLFDFNSLADDIGKEMGVAVTPGRSYEFEHISPNEVIASLKLARQVEESKAVSTMDGFDEFDRELQDALDAEMGRCSDEDEDEDAIKVSEGTIADKVAEGTIADKVDEVALADKVDEGTIADKVDEVALADKVDEGTIAAKVDEVALADKVAEDALADKVAEGAIADKVHEVHEVSVPVMNSRIPTFPMTLPSYQRSTPYEKRSHARGPVQMCYGNERTHNTIFQHAEAIMNSKGLISYEALSKDELALGAVSYLTSRTENAYHEIMRIGEWSEFHGTVIALDATLKGLRSKKMLDFIHQMYNDDMPHSTIFAAAALSLAIVTPSHLLLPRNESYHVQVIKIRDEVNKLDHVDALALSSGRLKKIKSIIEKGSNASKVNARAISEMPLAILILSKRPKRVDHDHLVVDLNTGTTYNGRDVSKRIVLTDSKAGDAKSPVVPDIRLFTLHIGVVMAAATSLIAQSQNLPLADFLKSLENEPPVFEQQEYMENLTDSVKEKSKGKGKGNIMDKDEDTDTDTDTDIAPGLLCENKNENTSVPPVSDSVLLARSLKRNRQLKQENADLRRVLQHNLNTAFPSPRNTSLPHAAEVAPAVEVAPLSEDFEEI